MAEELDPERLHLRNQLRSEVLPWIIVRAFSIPEIQQGIEQSDLAPEMLRDHVLETKNVGIATGPEFEAIYQLALGKDDRIDGARLTKELGRCDWPIRWGVYYDRITPSNPMSLFEALSGWCTIVLRDGVVPELRRVINAQISGGSSTLLRMGAVPGLVKAQDVSFMVSTRSTKQFRAAVARTHGNGAIGLAGPRGSGKTTLIEGYIAGLHGTGHSRAPLAVLVSCPVHYEARDFVLHLHASLCRSVLERISGKEGEGLPSTSWINDVLALALRLVFGSVIFVLALLPIVHVNFRQPIMPQIFDAAYHVAWWMQPLLAVAGCGVVILASNVLRSLRIVPKLLVAIPVVSVQFAVWSLFTVLFERSHRQRLRPDRDSGVSRLEQSAYAQLRQIRMLQTSTTGWSGKLTLPLASEAAATKSIQLAERPLTYPEVVGAFRGFMESCVDALGPMVIAIDELDKIVSVEQAQAFINDIKGIFGVSGCLYLVSVSDDAVITFERKVLGIRDAFDSAFDEIVSVEYVSLAEALDLIRSRVIGMPEPFGYLCYCLSCGLPRELIRVIRKVAEYRSDRAPKSLGIVCQELIRDDILARIREFRILVGRTVERDGAELLRPLIQLPYDASAKDLLDTAAYLKYQGKGAPQNPTLARLRLEAAMFAYHGATLKQIFVDELDEQRAWYARDYITLPGSFDRLCQARNAIGEDPQLAWLLLDEFRNAWNLELVSYCETQCE